jgi:MHS family alpha-ketoglutarate permease-like MFS transporter
MTSTAHDVPMDTASGKRFAVSRIQLRSIVGGCVGNLIEWYDFLVYSIFSIYFASSFFPQGDQTAQLLNVTAVAAVGYVARPLGSWLMGRYADRKGRRVTLAVSVSLMCFGSLLIAVTPTYATIGVAAPTLLVVARLLQGLSMGGEYGTSATYLSEMAPRERRGFFVGFLQVSVVSGQLAALALLLLLQHAILRPGQMEAWGWRIPFVIGGIFALFALYLRRGIAETDAFRETGIKKQNRGSIAPFSCIESNPAGGWHHGGGTISFYTYTVYMQKFMVNTVGMTKEAASLTTAAALLCYLPLQPLFGLVSDLIGRRPVMIFFGAAGAILTVPLLTAMSHAASAWEAFALNFAALFILSGFTSIHMLVKSELFPAEVRALGVGLPYAITTAILGGTTEWVALQFKAMGREEWFYWYVTGAVLISLVVYLIMPETRWTSRLDGATVKPPGSHIGADMVSGGAIGSSANYPPSRF